MENPTRLHSYFYFESGIIFSSMKLYPILFGLYPALYLWSVNSDQLPAFAALRGLLFALAVAVIVMVAARLLLREEGKAALAAVAALLLFYTFGAALSALAFWPWMGQLKLLAAWAVLLGLAVAGISRQRRFSAGVHRILTLVGGALVAAALVPLALHIAADPASAAPPDPASRLPSASPGGQGKPDIYYIVLDTYARQDALLELGYDNSSFVRGLEKLGFVVDPCAQSNYDQTHSSMTATLNMNYLDALGVPMYPGEQGERMADFAPRIKNSLVRQKVTALGYRMVTFKGVYPWLNISDSDLFYDPDAGRGVLVREESQNFQSLLARTTVLAPLLDLARRPIERGEDVPAPALAILRLLDPASSVFNTRTYTTYENSLAAFRALSAMPAEPGPKFVYAHLFSAHIPFSFNADGSLRSSGREDRAGYLGSTEYTSKRILEVVRDLLRGSSQPPVIILQGDHGWSKDSDRVRILNALYLPEPIRAEWKNGTTPVNTFRFLFDHLFGEQMPLLPDQSYHTPVGRAYRFDPVPPSCIP